MKLLPVPCSHFDDYVVKMATTQLTRLPFCTLTEIKRVLIGPKNEFVRDLYSQRSRNDAAVSSRV